ncbi:MAG: sigma-70 family RNA polymerase sigma factor [Acidobacteriaceae bacterium]|nr:sigma-70 family RNA polymerase sigma factor [Acidobacteriaceae bacterium]MBV9035167.1 sigma-70 family RNA polymerase sigma factor [Acidobacteriaceae bacterium]MBV9306062.1 sigma-70 family RNA polymerase sigma factor [Acidobacteriaceae bacterium]
MRWYTAEELILNAQGAMTKDMPKSLIEQRFDQLLLREGAALMRLAGAYTDTRSDRDDLFQEIALAIWQALPNFRGESSERTFLFRIAHNRSLAYLANRRTLRISPDEEERAPDPRLDPEQELLQEQERQQLLRAVRRLPVLYRQVTTLALEGLSYGEIGEILAVSESNVGARLNRARQMLRSFMEDKV